MDIVDIFGFASNRELYEILEHSTIEEREMLCKNNKFKAMCMIIDFRNDDSFREILNSFPDFGSGLKFIESVKPGFIYTEEFRKYVRGFLEITTLNNTTRFILGNLEYRVANNVDGRVLKESWLKDGKLHNTKGPAVIYYREDGKISKKSWYRNGKLNNPDGPAFVHYRENGKILKEYWYKNDKLYNTKGPAAVFYNSNGKLSKEIWYLDDKHHNSNGPAIILYDKDGKVIKKYWYLNDELQNESY